MNSLTIIIKEILPEIIYFFIGFLPIFLGYMFLGVCLFYKFQLFKNLNQSFLALFSLMQGDMIFQCYSFMIEEGIIGQLFLYSYLVFFMIIVQNIFVSILCSRIFENRTKEKES